MKLFFVGNRPKVLERWNKLLVDWKPEVIRAADITTKLKDGNEILLVHISSVDAADSKLIFSFKAHNPSAIVIVCTDTPNESEGVEVLQLGANGYTNTYVTGSLLSEVVKTVLRGDIWAGPELLQKLLRRLLSSSSVTDSKVDTAESISIFEDLSSREQDVLAVLVTGASNKDIARELDITERTVKAHLSSIFQKTGASDRISLVLMASKTPVTA
ncbi:helix-turn-helix transcriptional regulator [Neptuniibacter sp.]|uniref:helix-turn-helix transcriptional regulator n=1 Tax=Neptuniibacter sp. TaxID=1962643 RepID=UPI00261344C3|nr:response regulator transcription factor [Neptuniibacter sp.]MCP4596958.1 response regulator transcription factor [Neptuniibacter sp.]